MGAALPWIAIGSSVVGTLIQASGASAQASAAQQNAQAIASQNQYQAAVAENNKTISENYALAEQQRGAVMAQQKQQETAQRVGAVAAGTGASGLDMSGSPLRLTQDTLALGDLDARTIRYNAEKAAYGYRVQGTSYGAQAGLDRMAADDALKGGALGAQAASLNATGSIISGTAGVADKWLRYKQVGIV